MSCLLFIKKFTGDLLKPHPPLSPITDSVSSTIDNRPAAVNERVGQTMEEEWREQKIEWTKLPGIYLRLSKYRLSGKGKERGGVRVG